MIPISVENIPMYLKNSILDSIFSAISHIVLGIFFLCKMKYCLIKMLI